MVYIPQQYVEKPIRETWNVQPNTHLKLSKRQPALSSHHHLDIWENGTCGCEIIAHIQCTIHISHSFWPKNKKISHSCYEPMIHPLQLYDLIYVPYVRALLVHPIIPWIYQQEKTYNTLRSFHFGWDLSITRHMVACAALSYMYMRVSYRYIYPT